MKKISLVMIASMLFVFSLATADIPRLINYQGMLTDDEGIPIDGVQNLTFRIYDDTTGAGTLQWSETQSGVQVDHGLFNVVLGKSTTLNSAFDESYWLEVEVEGEVMPRIRMTSVGYAYRAGVADSAVVAVSTPTGGGWTNDGSVVRLIDNADSVGIGTSSPTHRLEVSCTQHLSKALRVGNDSSWFQVRTGGNTRLGLGDGHGNEAGFIFTTETDLGENAIGISGCADGGSCPFFLVCSESGGVGIGTTSPATLLDIRGLPNNPAVARVNQIGGINWAGWRVDRDSTEKWFVGLGNTNENLLFRRNSSSDDMVIDASGNVGIGTSEPDRKLHIVGDNARVLIEAASVSPEVNFKNSGDPASAVWALYKDGATDDFRFYQNGADRLTIQNATGNVGVGATDPGQKLDVNGIARIRSWGTAHTYDVQVNNNGDLCRVSSSKRYKKNIRGLESDPDKILKLEPVSFEWKTTSEKSIGLIAEDVDQLIPELVGYDKEGSPDAVRYELLSLYVLEVVKKQAQAMKELKAENDELKQRIEVLERE
jgi:hypothetical protein